VPAGDVDYELWGVGYAAVRRADPRIAAYVWAALGDAASVVNVGAGGGSYEPPPPVRVLAVEPAERMRAQRPPGAAPVVAGVADTATGFTCSARRCRLRNTNRYAEVFGDTLGEAREKHAKAAIKRLHAEGRTTCDGKGKVVALRITRP
jgi:hypothetical protein